MIKIAYFIIIALFFIILFLCFMWMLLGVFRDVLNMIQALKKDMEGMKK